MRNEIEFAELKTLAEIGTGNSNRQDATDDGQYNFYVRSKDILKINKWEYDEEAVIIPGEGGVGEIFHYANGKYALHQRAYRIHLINNSLLTKFLYYYMSEHFKEFIRKKALNAIVTSIRKPMIEQFEIPIPTLETQEKIVKILDTFTDLIFNLERELELRKKQYKYYSRNFFDSLEDCDSKLVGETCDIVKGKTPIQKAIPGEYPLVVTTSIRKSSSEYQFDSEAVCIPLVSSRGHGIASLNHVYYQSGKFALGNILCAVISQDDKSIKAKFLYYFFEEMKDLLIVPLMKGGANVALHMKDIKKIKIPVPPLETQEKIAGTLDKFTELISNIEREIVLRKKQYEFYREKLLTFDSVI